MLPHCGLRAVKPSPEAALAGFIAKYSSEIAELAHAALAKMRALLPGAVEMVYDNYGAAVIGFAATERVSEAIFSIALYPRWVTLYFLHGAELFDPHKLLRGDGKVVRRIVLEDAQTLDAPPVRALMAEALARSAHPFDPAQPNRIIIKSISAKQRPRRPTQPSKKGQR
jgi:hypothetical protein